MSRLIGVITPACWPTGKRLLLDGEDITNESFECNIGEGWAKCYIRGANGEFKQVEDKYGGWEAWERLSDGTRKLINPDAGKLVTVIRRGHLEIV